jgi:YegS/Rv2252/BmrU family lipid kinase
MISGDFPASHLTLKKGHHMDIVIIGNPISSGGNTGKRMEKLQSILESRGHQVTPYMTRFAGDGKNAIEGLSEGKDRIVVVGGDGTFNEIVSGLPDHSQVPVLHFPTGNANLMGKDLKLPEKEEKVADLVENGKVIMADVGVMNDKKFIMVAGMGFDARVTEEVKKIRKGKVSNLTYVLPFLRALTTTTGALFHVTVDDGAASAQGKAVIIGNVRNYAGICEIAWQAGVDTGVLDIVILPKEDLLSLATYLLYAKFSRIDRLPGVTYLKGSTIRIQSDQPIPVELDGDFCDRHDEVTIQLIPGSVPLVVP